MANKVTTLFELLIVIILIFLFIDNDKLKKVYNKLSGLLEDG